MNPSISASVENLLREPGAAQAAERGLVHILNVAAIRDTVGARWTRQAAVVEDFVVRAFQRGARDDDFIVRVNDADFILIQPGRDPMSALSRASQLMRETLSFFLGEAKTENVHISIVDCVSGDGVRARRLAGEDLRAASSLRHRDLALSEDGSAPWEAFDIPALARTSFILKRPGADDLQALFYVEPVWRLDKSAVLSFVVRTLLLQATPEGPVPVDYGDLPPSTHAVLAVRSLAFARSILGQSDVRPIGALHVPIGYDALTQSGPRTSVLADLKRHDLEGHRLRTMIEVTHVPVAVPAVRLSELVGQLKPFARAILIQTEAVAPPASWRNLGVQGLIHRLPGGMPERQSLANLQTFAAATLAMGLVCGVDGISSRSLSIAAWAAGFSHLAGEYLAHRCGDELVSQRFTVRDLYEAPASAASVHHCAPAHDHRVGSPAAAGDRQTS